MKGRKRNSVAKKILSILVAMSIGVSLVACGTAQPEEAAKTEEPEKADEQLETEEQPETKPAETEGGKQFEGQTVTFWVNKYGSDPSVQEQVLKELADSFKEETGATIEYSIIDWSASNQKLTLACTGGESPDVADLFFTRSFVKMGGEEYGPMIVDDVIENLGGEEAFYSAGKDEAFIDGHWYGIPWRADPRAIIYRTDLFEEAGITKMPETWDEVVDVAKKLTVKDDNDNITRAGMSWYALGGRFDQTYFSMLAANGGAVMNDDFTEFTFDSPESKETLQFIYDCVHEYGISPEDMVDATFDPMAEFISENVAMVVGAGSNVLNMLKSEAPHLEGKYNSAMIPLKDGDGYATATASAPISVMKTAKNVEAAKAWAEYFCSPESQKKVCIAWNRISSHKEVMEYLANEDPILANYAKAFEQPGNNPLDMPIDEWSQVDSWPDGPIPMMATEIIAGQDIDAAIQKGLEGANALIGK